MTITFASCFYVLKSKFDVSTYQQWMQNLFSIVNNFNLVIFTDEHSKQYIPVTTNPHIKIVIQPLDQFYSYKFRDQWIINHNNNTLLNTITCWELNMLWSEKVNFVKESQKHFTTNLYGWCDIGYFRNRPNDTNTNMLEHWPNPNKLNSMKPDKIYYGCIEPYNNSLLKPHVNAGKQLPPHLNTIAGGFFILHQNMIGTWHQQYYNMLSSFFQKGWLVKDDQQIIIYCALKYPKLFSLAVENSVEHDNWFMFQRLLK